MIHADVLGERARLSPGKTALVFVPTGERFTYRELNARAGKAAALLSGRLGLVKGDRVGLLAHNRVEYVDLFFAAAKAGLVLVPLGTRLTPRELAFIVDDAGLSALVYGSEFAETVAALRGESAVPRWIALDAPAAVGDLSWTGELREQPDRPFERTRCDGEDLHALLYTSGTTGKPKGVMVPHRMTSWNGWNTAICWGLTESDVSPVFTPLYHAGGLGAFLVPILAAGGTIVLHTGFDPAEVWATVSKERCTVVLGVPTIWKMLLEHPAFESADLSSIRWLISGGAPLPLYLIDAYQERGIVFKQGYGLTEVGVNCFAMSVEESVAKKGSKSFCAELKGTGAGALHPSFCFRLSQRSHPPGPPGRFVEPQRTRVPSGLKVTLISLNSVETLPLAWSSGGLVKRRPSPASAVDVASAASAKGARSARTARLEVMSRSSTIGPASRCRRTRSSPASRCPGPRATIRGREPGGAERSGGGAGTRGCGGRHRR